jgi:hypothetical protein
MATWVNMECGQCGEPFQLSSELVNVLHRSSQTFYCPHGHMRHFPQGESREAKLQREVNQLKQNKAYLEDRRREAEERADKERHRANGYKGHATRISKRIKHGVCICCNRTFADLARHMATKHPTFTPMAVDDIPRSEEKVA